MLLIIWHPPAVPDREEKTLPVGNLGLFPLNFSER